MDVYSFPPVLFSYTFVLSMESPGISLSRRRRRRLDFTDNDLFLYVFI